MDSDHKLVVKEEIGNEENCFKKALNLCSNYQNYKGEDSVYIIVNISIIYDLFQQMKIVQLMKTCN